MKKKLISLVLVGVLSSFSLMNSFAAYESKPYEDSTLITRYSYSDAGAKDIAATENSIIINRAGVLEERDANNNYAIKGWGKVTGIDCIDYAGSNFGLIGVNNAAKKIYFNCMTANNNYVAFPNEKGINTITAITAKIKYEPGYSGNNEPTLYLDIFIPGKYYGSRILEYKYYTHFGRLSFVKESSTGMYDRNDFAYANSKYVGVGGYYGPSFYAKNEIDTNGSVSDTGLPSGYNCHGYRVPESTSLNVVSPSKLAYGHGYYYSLVKEKYSAAIVRTSNSAIKFN